jgi:phosphoribosylglycinamide formyltransferase 1
LIRIAIFASGSGSNALKIIDYFHGDTSICVELVATNNSNAGIVQKASDNGVDVLIFNKAELYESGSVLKELKNRGVDFIVLAGFLWLIPMEFIKTYQGRIINIHPALLPEYGGKGLYGDHVHRAILANEEKVTGITIHVIDEEYDKGDIIFQTSCPVYEHDTIDTVRQRVQALEHAFFACILESYIHSINKKTA